VREGRELDLDGAVWSDGASATDDAHDACSRRLFAGGKIGEDGCHETGAEVIHLNAGSAEAGDFDDCSRADVEAGGCGQGEQIDAGGGDVFSEIAGEEGKAGRAKGFEEFGLQEMDLGEVGLSGIAPGEVAVADGGAAVSVALHAQTGEEVDVRLRMLAEGVGSAEAYGDDTGRHQRGFRVRE